MKTTYTDTFDLYDLFSEITIDKMNELQDQVITIWVDPTKLIANKTVDSFELVNPGNGEEVYYVGILVGGLIAKASHEAGAW